MIALIPDQQLRDALARDWARTLGLISARRTLTPAEARMRAELAELLEGDSDEQRARDAEMVVAYDLADTLNRFGRYALQN